MQLQRNRDRTMIAVLDEARSHVSLGWVKYDRTRNKPNFCWFALICSALAFSRGSF
ncbi:hypothetical protein [Myxacorys almedinensis]|uniref:Uncharacterized protein n=1 Tax=Myxacorys almedinensis A TaxID=2690445 RepID=A0A8J7ZAJ7_9CYAN|nr:hypothetical protein [Myxacorys almedinensis]NDJ18435.1 hypothetical protein [Myxacorys almedinensis A]